ncbi:hypothetical protein OG698_09775 [Streptomyces sp. NBC_01003]|nr:hypothetical protein OG698_09775 [Streptomyces sp. NBC_01003]
MTTWIGEGREGPSSGSALWARMMVWQAWRMSWRRPPRPAPAA